MSRSHSTFKAGLMGPWGTGNLGCAATVDAMIQNIKIYIPDSQIVIFSLVPTDSEERHGVTSFPISREDWSKYEYPDFSQKIANWLKSHPFPFFRKLEFFYRRVPLEFRLSIQTYHRLKQIDLLIVTGGGQLLDFWGEFKHPYWLFKYAILSRLAGIKIMFVSVGAGPIKGKLGGLFIKIALSLAAYRSYRDEESKKYVGRVLGFKRNDPVYPDLVYSLTHNNQRRHNNERPVVGLGVIAYCDPRHWPEKDAQKYETYLKKLAAFSSWLIENQFNISFIVGESWWDHLVVIDLIDILEKDGVMELAGDQVRDESIITVRDLLAQISESDFLVVSRFHNIILPTLFGKPVIALSYHPKTDALMAELGQSRYCLPIEQFDVDTLITCFADLVTNCKIINIELTEKVKTYSVALDEQYERIFAAYR